MEAPPGSPLPGLSAEERARFAGGMTDFDRSFTPEDGLGPLFNQTRCSSCHDLPVRGGHGAESVRKATRWDPARGCDLLTDRGGDLLQASVTPPGRAVGLLPEHTPEGATAVVDLHAPSLFGLGLVAAVPVASIVARADPDDRDGDGISGRVGADASGAPAFFGQKASQPSLRAFIEDAARGEIGLTTPGHPAEQRPAGGELPAGADPAADPEVDEAFLDALADYVRLLAVPPVATPSTPEGRASAQRGARAFTTLGCAGCHTPTWTTAADAPGSLAGRRFRAYSDFLLHDMGAELADVCGPGASPSEWRTARLVGLSLRSVFLHDGRAQRIEDAIGYHGGEAAASRAAFRALSGGERMDLIRFLQTL